MRKNKFRSNRKRKFENDVPQDLGTVELEITGVAFGGKGLAKKDGKVYFVKNALPTETVVCRLEKDKKNFAEGFAEKIITSSVARMEANCPHFGTCGGCQWLGVDYDNQLEWKKSFIQSAMRKNARIEDLSIKMLSSPDQKNYRSRVMIRVHVDRDGKPTFGFFKMKSRELVRIKYCEIAGGKINALLDYLNTVTLKGMESSKLRMEIQEIPYVEGQEKSLLVTVTPAQGKDQNLEPVIKLLKNSSLVHWAGKVNDLKDAKPVLFEKDLDVDFYVSPGQFYQVNIEHNKTLRKLVFDKVSEILPKSVYDVCCGSGNLSLPLARIVDEIVGVEVNPTSIKNAMISASESNLNGVCDIKYDVMDSNKHMRMMLQDKKRFDLIILDPPREGMSGGVDELVELGPDDILYISCDPQTLARDINGLVGGGYTVEQFYGLDFFPQTYHVESFVHLTKVKNQ